MSQRKKDQQNPALDPFEVQNPLDVPLFELPEFPWPWPAPLKVEIVDSNPRPLWLQVVERIMTKALDHKNAGRVDQFSQILVPKSDFEALKSHFGDEPWISTCLGLFPVYPVNPDGATFVD